TVKLWDTGSGQQLLTFGGHTWVESVAFSPDGQLLASAGQDGIVRLWDARTGQELLSLRGHSQPIFSISFSPDGQRLASGSWDTKVKLWDTRSGQELLSLEHTYGVVCLAFSSDSQ